jgi:NAD+ kinase
MVSEPIRTIGLYAHTGKAKAAELVRQLADAFRVRGIEVLYETETAKMVQEPHGMPVAEIAPRCSLFVALGGDGTILRLVHELGETICPIFGINLGSLGFLTCVPLEDASLAVEAIVSGRMVFSHRTRLAVQVERGGRVVASAVGLNEALISRGELSRLIKLDTFIDGEPLTQYNADGLIVATSTGSTAYSLSAGGPVVVPGSGVFVVTPICPHALTNRSVVLDDASELSIRPLPSETPVTLTVDGHELLRLQPGDWIRIRQSQQKLPLATLPGVTFPQVLRQKLKWSGSAV